MKRYPIKNIIFISILIFILIIGYLIATFLDMKIADNFNPQRIIFSIIFSLCIIYFCIELILSGYKIIDTNLVIKIAIMKFIIPLNTITDIKKYTKTNKLCLLFFIEQTQKIHYVQIKKEYFDEFIDELKSINNYIIVEEIK